MIVPQWSLWQKVKMFYKDNHPRFEYVLCPACGHSVVEFRERWVGKLSIQEEFMCDNQHRWFEARTLK